MRHEGTAGAAGGLTTRHMSRQFMANGERLHLQAWSPVAHDRPAPAPGLTDPVSGAR